MFCENVVQINDVNVLQDFATTANMGLADPDPSG